MENKEKLLLKGKKHWMDWFWTVVWCGVFVWFGYEYWNWLWIVAGMILLSKIIKSCTMKLEISNLRIRGRGGVINIIEADATLDKVDSVTVESSLFGKMLGYGNVYIKTDTGSFVYKKVKKPMRIKDTIIEAKEILQKKDFVSKENSEVENNVYLGEANVAQAENEKGLEKLLEKVKKKMEKGKTEAEIADELDEDVELIHEICEKINELQ